MSERWLPEPYNDMDDDGTVYAIAFYDSAFPVVKVGYTARPMINTLCRVRGYAERNGGNPLQCGVLWERAGSLRREIYLQAGLSFDYPTLHFSKSRRREETRHPELS